MEGDMITLANVCLTVVISLCYCYWICKIVPAGTGRLLSVLPIIFLYLFIPLNFSTVHLRGNAGFFFAWLANFKLLLFAFDKGPLSSDPSISLPRFVAVACLPIKIRKNPPPNQPRGAKTAQIKSNLLPSNPSQPHQNGTNPPPDPSQGSKSSNFETDPSSGTPSTRGHSKQGLSTINPSKGYTTLLKYATKGLLLAALVKIYDYSDHIHPKVIMGMYCFHIYFMLELILAIVAALARTMLGLELEPQFKDPLLSTSLQDFWGRRWNLMVTSILRPTVYEPALKSATNVIGPKWAQLPAVLGTFIVSGLMHELILYYMGRLRPTFRMTWFFVLHGLCLTVEIALKKALTTAKYRLPGLVSRTLTTGFVAVTCFWLFLPEFIRCRIDVKAFEEYAALGALVKNLTSAF